MRGSLHAGSRLRRGTRGRVGVYQRGGGLQHTPTPPPAARRRRSRLFYNTFKSSHDLLPFSLSLRLVLSASSLLVVRNTNLLVKEDINWRHPSALDLPRRRTVGSYPTEWIYFNSRSLSNDCMWFFFVSFHFFFLFDSKNSLPEWERE